MSNADSTIATRFRSALPRAKSQPIPVIQHLTPAAIRPATLTRSYLDIRNAFPRSLPHGRILRQLRRPSQLPTTPAQLLGRFFLLQPLHLPTHQPQPPSQPASPSTLLLRFKLPHASLRSLLFPSRHDPLGLGLSPHSRPYALSLLLPTHLPDHPPNPRKPRRRRRRRRWRRTRRRHGRRRWWRRRWRQQRHVATSRRSEALLRGMSPYSFFKHELRVHRVHMWDLRGVQGRAGEHGAG